MSENCKMKQETPKPPKGGFSANGNRLRLAVLIPTRGDRPELLANCLRMMAAQTLQPGHIEVVDDAPLSGDKDITWRYRTGYERLKGYDLIALIEDDDWYALDYLETMVGQWQRQGRPDIFGTDYTIYYHLALRAWFTMEHPERASAMNTLIKGGLSFPWCVDHEPYTDMHLWRVIKGISWHPDRHISMGIKHGQGLCGGNNHKNRANRYKNQDANFDFLRETMDNASFAFYSSYDVGEIKWDAPKVVSTIL